MSDIPADVILDTLIRLPVKSLLKFRCVCKSWRALIDSPRFVNMHLNHSLDFKRANVIAKFILCGYSSLFHVSFKSLSYCIDAHSITLNYPLKDDVRRTFVLGYCNGLMLISHGTYFLLWNPSTRKYCEIPCPEPENNPPVTVYQYSAGLGYDHNTNDYKVVSLQSFGEEESYAETFVYSFQSNSWRRTKEHPLWIFQEVGGIFVFGALHWVIFVPKTEVEAVLMVAAFDLESDKYDFVPMPDNLPAPERIDLGVFDECLSMSCKYKNDRVDIWLMRDRANKESWVKFLTLKQVGVLNLLKENVIPISYFSRSRKSVILEKDKELLFLYDIELKKSVTMIPTSLGPSTFNTYLYMESLVELKAKSHEEVSMKMHKAEEKPKKPKKRDDFLSTGFKLKL